VYDRHSSGWFFFSDRIASGSRRISSTVARSSGFPAAAFARISAAIPSARLRGVPGLVAADASASGFFGPGFFGPGSSGGGVCGRVPAPLRRKWMRAWSRSIRTVLSAASVMRCSGSRYHSLQNVYAMNTAHTFARLAPDIFSRKSGSVNCPSATETASITCSRPQSSRLFPSR